MTPSPSPAGSFDLAASERLGRELLRELVSPAYRDGQTSDSLLDILARIEAAPAISPAALATSLHVAAAMDATRDDPTVTEALLRAGAHPDPLGEAPPMHSLLNLCVGLGAPRIAGALLRHGADPNFLGSKGDYPLSRLVSEGGKYFELPMARMLLDAGANPEGPAGLERLGALSPLCAAAQSGRMELAKLLIERGARPDARAFNGALAWEIARDEERAELSAFLRAAFEAQRESQELDASLLAPAVAPRKPSL